ncbi:hypothetical protein BURK1_00116 [Burkholderiales bacterium]|nr:hypothetical protein BURK1_00116 [Burkholderiales bacterium]
MRASAANGFGDAIAGPVGRPVIRPGCRVDPGVDSNGSSRLVRSAGAPLRAVARVARRLFALWKRSRDVRDTYLALREVDVRTLHDLGIDRSEILSVAAEIGGDADPTRVRSMIARRTTLF